MALGPTVLLPPLYEIQRSIQRIEQKYNNNVFLNVLDKEEFNESDYPEISSRSYAPRPVVYSFISNLSEQLFRYNILQSTLEDEKRLKKRISNGLYTVFVLTLVVVSTALWIMLGFKIKDKNTIYFAKAEYSYFSILILFIFIYCIMISGKLRKKYNNMYDTIYQNDNIFNTEPRIKHLTDMLKSNQRGLHNQFRQKKLNFIGSNPFLGYFLNVNRNMDVCYTFVPDLQASENISDGYLKSRKRFVFSQDKTNPYSLTKDSLLANNNIPAHVVQPNGPGYDNFKYVDPFMNDETVRGDSEILRKKLQKFDAFGQYSRIHNSVLFFETLLTDQNVQQDDSPQFKRNISRIIKNNLNLNHMIILNNIIPTQNFLNNSFINKRSMTRDTFLNKALYQSRYPVIYYNYDNQKCYNLTLSDLQQCIFTFRPSH